MRRRIAIAIILPIWALTTTGKHSVSGDEPHYLIIAQSILADGDLDLRNNYAQDDARLFGHSGLRDDGHTRDTVFGSAWSTHDIGLPVALLPVYATARGIAGVMPEPLLARFKMSRGLFAYSIVSVTLILLTALGALWLFDALRAEAPDQSPTIAAILTVTLALTPPVLAHAFLVFPETLAFVVVCWALRFGASARHDARVGEAFALAAALGATPWLHRKYSLFVLGLVLLIALRRREWFTRQPRAMLIALAVVFTVPHLALYVWTYYGWGQFGGPQLMDASRFSLATFRSGAIGLIFDREYGLLAYSPVYLLAFPAAVLAPRGRRWWLVPALLLYLPMAAFAEWWAGFSPAARYLVPITPLIALTAGGSFDTRVMRAAACALLAFQLAIAVSIAAHARNLWPHREGINRAVAPVPVLGPLYEGLLPSLAASPSRAEVLRCLLIVPAGTCVLVMAARRERRRRTP